MKKSIYLVEDDAGINDLISMLLMTEPVTVHSYFNLTDFKKKLEQSIPDLIIMDIMLPDGKGNEMCYQIKQMFRTQNIPVVLMSARGDGEAMALTAKADDFIPKPFDITDFSSMVEKYITP